MKNLSLRSFGLVLFVFAISVILTMYSMISGDDEGKLLGLNYGYFLLPLLMVNLFICFVNINKLNFSGFVALVVLWSIMVSFIVVFGASNMIVNLIRVNIWTTTFLSTYILAKTNNNTIDFITKLFVIIFFVSFFFFWQGKIFQQNEMKIGLETSSNAIYCLVTIVPFILLLKNKGLGFTLLLITFVCTVFSNKRGAAIIIALILIPAMNNFLSMIKRKGIRNLLVVLIGVIFVISFFYIGNYYVGGRLIERFNDVEETGGSGRLWIWTDVLNEYQESSLLEQLFGHGHCAVAGLGLAAAAHNDFLEVLYDYGILGLMIYIAIHVSLIKKTIKLRKSNNQLFFPYVSMCLIFVTMSMVSILIIQQRYLVYMAVFWGMLEGGNYNYQYIQSKKNVV